MLKTFDITYCDETSCFSLQTEHSTYIIGSADGYLGHVCFGGKVPDGSGLALLRKDEYSYMKGVPGDKSTGPIRSVTQLKFGVWKTRCASSGNK